MICRVRNATSKCRRCGKDICSACHFHHGLCASCARVIGKAKAQPQGH